jgi:CTP synthase (UTP-ammonia lyase)
VLVEYARNVAGIADATHAENDPHAGTHVVTPLACALYGESREVRTVPGTRAAAICGGGPMAGYHFCGYGLDAAFLARLEAAGLVVSGHASDAGVEFVEIVELPDHPFFLATLFHPQMAPEESALHPLLVAFADAVAVAGQ